MDELAFLILRKTFQSVFTTNLETLDNESEEFIMDAIYAEYNHLDDLQFTEWEVEGDEITYFYSGWDPDHGEEWNVRHTPYAYLAIDFTEMSIYVDGDFN